MPASKILLTIETDTKKEETKILNGFLQRLQYSSESATDREQPDFELYLDNKLIGIEITKYYSDYTTRGSKTQLKLSEWLTFTKKLKKKLTTINNDFSYLYGAIHFHKDKVNYNELLKTDYFNELKNLIESTGLKKTEQKSIEISRKNFPLLSKYIERIYLRDMYPDNIYLWWDSSLQSGLVINNESALNFIIDKKEKLSKKYKQDYFQKWLIVYAGGVGLHDMFSGTRQEIIRQGTVSFKRISDSEIKKLPEIKSNYFTHIFVWDKFTETIFQVFPYEKKIFDYGEKTIWINHLPIKLK